MQPKIKIGLTYTGTDEKHNNYVRWLKGNDDIEIVILSTEHNNADKVKSVDGLVLSGGLDIHPKKYNKSTNYPNAPEAFNEARDVFETNVFNISQQQKIPVLGVCRGMQLINCILGGDLTQDVGEANTLHRNDGADKKHEVNVLPDTLLSSITHAEHIHINSAHHQCVNKLGKGLMINAKSEDGIIEGYEWKEREGKPFMLCVQWHPERMYKMKLEESSLSKNIRNHFIAEVIKNKTGK